MAPDADSGGSEGEDYASVSSDLQTVKRKLKKEQLRYTKFLNSFRSFLDGTDDSDDACYEVERMEEMYTSAKQHGDSYAENLMMLQQIISRVQRGEQQTKTVPETTFATRCISIINKLLKIASPGERSYKDMYQMAFDQWFKLTGESLDNPTTTTTPTSSSVGTIPTSEKEEMKEGTRNSLANLVSFYSTYSSTSRECQENQVKQQQLVDLRCGIQKLYRHYHQTLSEKNLQIEDLLERVDDLQREQQEQLDIYVARYTRRITELEQQVHQLRSAMRFPDTFFSKLMDKAKVTAKERMTRGIGTGGTSRRSSSSQSTPSSCRSDGWDKLDTVSSHTLSLGTTRSNDNHVITSAQESDKSNMIGSALLRDELATFDMDVERVEQWVHDHPCPHDSPDDSPLVGGNASPPESARSTPLDDKLSVASELLEALTTPTHNGGGPRLGGLKALTHKGSPLYLRHSSETSLRSFMGDSSPRSSVIIGSPANMRKRHNKAAGMGLKLNPIPTSPISLEDGSPIELSPSRGPLSHRDASGLLRSSQSHLLLPSHSLVGGGGGGATHPSTPLHLTSKLTLPPPTSINTDFLRHSHTEDRSERSSSNEMSNLTTLSSQDGKTPL